jgi:hypothetical protein
MRLSPSPSQARRYSACQFTLHVCTGGYKRGDGASGVDVLGRGGASSAFREPTRLGCTGHARKDLTAQAGVSGAALMAGRRTDPFYPLQVSLLRTAFEGVFEGPTQVLNRSPPICRVLRLSSTPLLSPVVHCRGDGCTGLFPWRSTSQRAMLFAGWEQRHLWLIGLDLSPGWWRGVEEGCRKSLGVT